MHSKDSGQGEKMSPNQRTGETAVRWRSGLLRGYAKYIVKEIGIKEAHKLIEDVK